MTCLSVFVTMQAAAPACVSTSWAVFQVFAVESQSALKSVSYTSPRMRVHHPCMVDKLHKLASKGGLTNVCVNHRSSLNAA